MTVTDLVRLGISVVCGCLMNECRKDCWKGAFVDNLSFEKYKVHAGVNVLV
jgi:hypothetical protein